MRIIVADDDPGFVCEMEHSLGSHGFEVTVAMCGGQVVKELLKSPGVFDCLVLDMHMQGLDGIHTVRLARKVAANLPVVMITTARELKSEISALCEGVDAIVTKPFSACELADAIISATKKRLKL